MAHRTELARKNKQLKKEHEDRASTEFAALIKRKKRAERSKEQVESDNQKSKKRLKKHQNLKINEYFKKPTLAKSVKDTIKKHNLYSFKLHKGNLHFHTVCFKMNFYTAIT